MQHDHATHIGASINQRGQIELRGSYNPMLMEFYHSLPYARWDKAKLCWTCQYTPAACWRIVSEAAVHSRIEAADEIRESGQAFFRSTLDPTKKGEQPSVRKTESWKHQCEAYWFADQRQATLLAMMMGTGKSLVAVNLAQNDDAKRVLVITPVSVMGVWRREFMKHAATSFNVFVLDKGTTKKKAEQVRQHLTLCRVRGERAVVVVNYESSWRDELLTEFLDCDWDVVICDESARIKAHNSRQSKAAADIGRRAKRRLALSGTPMGNSPLDIFGQFRFLDPGIFGTSWSRFRTAYAISGPFGADQVVGYKNLEDLAKKMALLTYQVGAEVLDLPPQTHQMIPFDLSTDERRLQDEMANDLIAFLDGGGEVTAANGLVKLLRLQQTTSGFVKDDADAIRRVGTSKQDVLADLLQDIHEPVVVFCKFTESLNRIAEIAANLKLRYGEVSGRRKDLTPHSQMPDTIDVLGVNHQAGGVGIDLTRARISIFLEHPWSLGDYEQCLARVHRPGQDRAVLHYHLNARDSVDEVVMKALVKKANIVKEVISYLKGVNY